jgi:hypothetical protein
MAATVGEIMNRELFSVRPEESADRALRYVLALGITGVPVLDAGGRPLGVASFRDLLRAEREAPVERAMTSPAAVVRWWADIGEAARMIAQTGYHRLVVIDDAGKAIGIVSTLDVLRGLIGAPAPHPAAFPHYDRETGLTWTDDATLSLENAGLAPNGPGVLLLIHGRPGVPEAVVWGETSENVRTRIFDLVAAPQSSTPLLAHWLERGDLRFRAGTMTDRGQLKGALERLMGRPPGNGG